MIKPMKPILTNLSVALLLALAAEQVRAQGTFQNLDFENGTFIPIPGDPYGRVEFSPAMPGWSGYLGANQINWILHNNLFLSGAGIAIMGPDNPLPDRMHGHYFVILQNSFPVPTDVPGIAQTGMVPSTAKSVLFLSNIQFPGIGLSFADQQFNTSLLQDLGGSRYLWGADISQYSGQTGELRFFGEGYLDFIQFSNQPIPEPSPVGLLGLGALLLGWRFKRNQT